MKEVSRILAFLIFVGSILCGPDFVNWCKHFRCRHSKTQVNRPTTPQPNARAQFPDRTATIQRAFACDLDRNIHPEHFRPAA
jgi:hypothetical protein